MFGKEQQGPSFHPTSEGEGSGNTGESNKARLENIRAHFGEIMNDIAYLQSKENLRLLSREGNDIDEDPKDKKNFDAEIENLKETINTHDSESFERIRGRHAEFLSEKGLLLEEHQGNRYMKSSGEIDKLVGSSQTYRFVVEKADKFLALLKSIDTKDFGSEDAAYVEQILGDVVEGIELEYDFNEEDFRVEEFFHLSGTVPDEVTRLDPNGKNVRMYFEKTFEKYHQKMQEGVLRQYLELDYFGVLGKTSGEFLTTIVRSDSGKEGFDLNKHAGETLLGQYESAIMIKVNALEKMAHPIEDNPEATHNLKVLIAIGKHRTIDGLKQDARDFASEFGGRSEHIAFYTRLRALNHALRARVEAVSEELV